LTGFKGRQILVVMMKIRLPRSLARVLVLVLGVVALTATGGPAASAIDGTVIPLNATGFMVVDDAGGHVFLTGSPVLGDESVVVAGLDGSVVTSVANLPGASGLESVGNDVLVADCGSNQLYVIDASTLQQSGTIDTGTSIGGSCDIAATEGRLWFVNTDGVLSSVELAAPHATVTYPAFVDGSAPILASSDTGLLALADSAYPSTTVQVIDTSGASPQLVVSGEPSVLGTTSRYADAQMSADGTRLVLAGSFMFEVNPLDLSTTRIFRPTIRGTATYVSSPGVAVTPSGTYVAGGAGKYAYSWDGATFVRTVGLGFKDATRLTVATRGIALTPDGRRLFVLAGVPSSGNIVTPHLYVVDGPALATTSLTLTSSSLKIRYGKSVRLTAHLTHFDAESVIDIYATPFGASRRLVASGHPNNNGNFVVTVSPSRNTVYEAQHAATSKTQSALSAPPTPVRVAVVVKEALSGYYATSDRYHLYHYSSACASTHRGCPKVTLSVAPNHAGQTIYVSAKVKSSGHWYTAFDHAFKLNSKSRVTFTIVYRSRAIIGHEFRLIAVFPRDDDHFGNRSPWRYFRITQ
jgi:YVTN family beta-propeller protein